MTPEARRPPQPHAGGPQDGKSLPLLLAEPDEKLAGQAMARFAAAGVNVVVCHDGAEALLQAGATHPGAVLLGAPLPVVDAAAVTRLIGRLSPVPVIVGAGQDGATEATDALAAGAVAFVARPYRIEEILPLLTAGMKTGDGSTAPLVVGDIELDPAGFHVFVRGRSLQLPVREFMLLRYLMEHANRLVSRSELTQALWGTDNLDSNTLTVHVRRVRNRLREGAGSCCTIDAIRGMGYRLECSPSARAAAQPSGSAPPV
uniref:Putative response regulator n=3 Tax=unclassified Streptomyces TaxID=2593676 RepID=V9ZA13_9ACTN|nr:MULTISPECIES: response regulator transcription factor [unclassified Streptomyces]AHE39031.1 Putative response regulator [Streptomyces sp. FR1]AHE39556.1 Putative response regulator [Streptomyces sp. F2]AHE40271.1 Putative response regulator [Streptomyces sp. F12]